MNREELRRSRADMLLKRVNLAEHRRKKVKELSGGMKKRVGLARAIACEPSVIFYDEPSSGLDPIMTARIDELIVSTQKKLGVTSVVVTHDMASACRIADRIAIMHQGCMVECGDTDTILRHPQSDHTRQLLRDVPKLER